jgi:cell division protein FtsI (penicillin-binding protein 3)
MAAPIFQRSAEATLRHMGVPPTTNAPPPVVVARNDSASITPASATITTPTIVPLVHNSTESSLFPELRGMSARDALRTLAQLGVTARLQGAGTVVDQTPAAGMPLERGSTCTLILDRSPAHASAPEGPQP